MSLNTKTPLSYVRSTNTESPLLGERRRRPSFSLFLSIPNSSPYGVTQSPLTNSELSPSLCPSLSPDRSIFNTPFSAPSTPVDAPKSEWPRNVSAPSSEDTSMFDHVAWSELDAPGGSTISTPSADKDVGLQFAPRIPQGAELADQPLFQSRPAPPFPLLLRQAPILHTFSRFGGDASSVNQELVVSNREHPMRTERAWSGSLTSLVPRRSRMSYDHDLSISNPTQSPKRNSSPQPSPPALPASTVSASYQQLSAQDVKNLKLDPFRRHYKCLMEGCSRVFGRKSNVENHIRTHLDDKPFVCSLDTCKAAFVRKGDLQRHEEIHRPSRTHMCSCGQTFSRNDALTKHIRKGICGPNGSSMFS